MEKRTKVYRGVGAAVKAWMRASSNHIIKRIGANSYVVVHKDESGPWLSLVESK